MFVNSCLLQFIVEDNFVVDTLCYLIELTSVSGPSEIGTQYVRLSEVGTQYV